MAASADSSGSSVRRRRGGGETEPADSGEDTGGDTEEDTEEDTEGDTEEDTGDPEGDTGPPSLRTGTYWLTRIVLLRSVAFIYLVAFSVAYNQNKQLIGERGLLPCGDYLKSVKRYVGGRIGAAAFAYAPTVLWLADWGDMDANLDGIALAGMALAAFVLVTGMANMLVMVTLWGLYHSLVGVGQLW
ncbi:Lipase maturation factor 1 [Liparis tanakae]|uniref:Lipase maturation factor 1 n=1 Tax=Liparis tanakae TaxID=230148 RepID=A0A4Z2FAH3_9TELE|nr:Lipase maturation factor 1 [Liparis tanakae]